MASKNIKGIVRLRVGAGKASPSPAIGQSLGPLGVNMMEFCRTFNDRTSKMIEGIPIPVTLTAFQDRTFSFETKTPPASWFIKRATNLTKGSTTPGQNEAAFATTIGLRHLYEIALIKQQDEHVAHIPLESLCKNLIGTAKSMGIQVVDK